MPRERSPLQSSKLLLVLPSSTGGIGSHVASLARGLVARGADVIVAGPAAADELFGFGRVGAGFQPVEIPARPGPADADAVRALRPLMARASLTHAHGLRAGLITGLVRRRTPKVLTLHNAVLGSAARRAALTVPELLAIRRADVVLGASSDLVARARRLGARDARLGPVAAPPLAPPRRTRAEVRAMLGCADRPLVVAVGRLHPQKRYDVLIDAAGMLAAAPPAAGVPLFVIAGEGPLSAELTRLIAGVDAPVRLLGRRSDVSDLLAAADVVVLPSEWEARALVAQEALRARRPLVATSVGGLPELVGDGALLVPPGDVSAFAAAVRRVVDDPAFADALAARGLARSRSWPDEAATVEQVADVFAELLARPR